jgi:hypothetical protein
VANPLIAVKVPPARTSLRTLDSMSRSAVYPRSCCDVERIPATIGMLATLHPSCGACVLAARRRRLGADSALRAES